MGFDFFWTVKRPTRAPDRRHPFMAATAPVPCQYAGGPGPQGQRAGRTALSVRILPGLHGPCWWPWQRATRHRAACSVGLRHNPPFRACAPAPTHRHRSRRTTTHPRSRGPGGAAGHETRTKANPKDRANQPGNEQKPGHEPGGTPHPLTRPEGAPQARGRGAGKTRQQQPTNPFKGIGPGPSRRRCS